MKLRLSTILLAVLPLTALVAWLFVSVEHARKAASESDCQGRMAWLAAALQGYHAAHGEYPPTVVRSSTGEPLYSGLMLTIPYVSTVPGSRFNDQEPWSSLGNRTLVTDLNHQTWCANDIWSRANGFSSYVYLQPPKQTDADRGSLQPKHVILFECPRWDHVWAEPVEFQPADLARITPGHDPHGLGIRFSDGTFSRLPLTEVRRLVAAQLEQAKETRTHP